MDDALFRHRQPLENGFFRAARRCRILSVEWVDPVTCVPVAPSVFTIRGSDGAVIAPEDLPAELAPGDVIHVTVNTEGPLSFPPRVLVEDL
jgi:hypothetical protein